MHGKIWGLPREVSPCIAEMTALLPQKFYSYTQEDVYEYFVKNEEDLELQGVDENTGFELARMRNQDEIIVIVSVCGKFISVNGKKIEIEQPAMTDK